MKLVLKKADVPLKEIIISVTAGLGFYAKQFYLAQSGTLQIGDFFLMLSAFLVILFRGLHLQKKDAPFLLFIIATIFINCAYYLSYSDIRFFLSILYMLFNGIAVVFLFRPMLNKVYFLRTIQISCKLVIISQLVFLVTGVGKWEFLGTRYVGTFNDPNQYGFYVLTCFFCIYLISTIRNEKLHIFWVLLTAVEIIPSASTGMILAFSVFSIGYIIGLNSTEKIISNKKIVLALFLLFILMLITALFYEQLLYFLGDLNIFGLQRLTQRLLYSSSSESLGMRFMENRGLVRIIEMPYYFLFGSGEGGWIRFKPINNEGYELHSTVLGLAYYYGIIPFCFLIQWVKTNIARIKPSAVFVYIALFLEALTLINHRQPIFWFLIVLASHEALKKQKYTKLI